MLGEHNPTTEISSSQQISAESQNPVSSMVSTLIEKAMQLPDAQKRELQNRLHHVIAIIQVHSPKTVIPEFAKLLVAGEKIDLKTKNDIENFLKLIAKLTSELEEFLQTGKLHGKSAPFLSCDRIFSSFSIYIFLCNLLILPIISFILTVSATQRTLTQPAMANAFLRFVSCELCPPGTFATNSSTPNPTWPPTTNPTWPPTTNPTWPPTTNTSSVSQSLDCPANLSGILFLISLLLLTVAIPLVIAKLRATFARPLSDLDSQIKDEMIDLVHRVKLYPVEQLQSVRADVKTAQLLTLLTQLKEPTLDALENWQEGTSCSIKSTIVTCKSLLTFCATNFPFLEVPVIAPPASAANTDTPWFGFFSSKQSTPNESEEAGLLSKSKGRTLGYGTASKTVTPQGDDFESIDLEQGSKGKGERRTNVSPPRPTMPMTAFQPASSSSTISQR